MLTYVLSPYSSLAPKTSHSVGRFPRWLISLKSQRPKGLDWWMFYRTSSISLSFL